MTNFRFRSFANTFFKNGKKRGKNQRTAGKKYYLEGIQKQKHRNYVQS